MSIVQVLDCFDLGNHLIFDDEVRVIRTDILAAVDNGVLLLNGDALSSQR